MAIEFDCPHCRFHYRLKDEYAGKPATCKSCRRKIVIPNPVTIPDDTPLPAPLDAEAAEAAALAALADEPAKAERDVASKVIAVECPHCTFKWTEPLERAGKNVLCKNPECKQRIKIPEPKDEGQYDWRHKKSKLPEGAKRDQEKLEGVQDAGDVKQLSHETVKQTLLEEDLEPRPLKQKVMFVLLALGLLTSVVLGARYLMKSRTEGKENRLMQEAQEEFAKSAEMYPKDELALLSAVQYIAAGEHAVRHNDEKKMKEALEQFAKAREALRSSASPARNALCGELALSLLVLGGTEQEGAGPDPHPLDPGDEPEGPTQRAPLQRLRGTPHDARSRARGGHRLPHPPGPAAHPRTDRAGPARSGPRSDPAGGAVQSGGTAGGESGRRAGGVPRRPGGARRARGGRRPEGPRFGRPQERSCRRAQILFSVLKTEKAPVLFGPPLPGGGAVTDPVRCAYTGIFTLEDKLDDALQLAQRVSSTPDAQLRALALCADWASAPGPALDAAYAVVAAYKDQKNKISPYLALRLSQIAAAAGRHEQANLFALAIADESLKAWAQGDAVRIRLVSAPKEKGDEGWMEVPEDPKNLRAGHAWARLWIARQNTRISGDRAAEVKAVSAWPSPIVPFGKAGVALGLQDK